MFITPTPAYPAGTPGTRILAPTSHKWPAGTGARETVLRSRREGCGAGAQRADVPSV
jgi:hypothetical protein